MVVEMILRYEHANGREVESTARCLVESCINLGVDVKRVEYSQPHLTGVDAEFDSAPSAPLQTTEEAGEVEGWL